MLKNIGLVCGLILPSFYTAACDKTKEEKRFFDFAMAICFGSAFESDEVKQDFNRAAGGIVEHSHMPLEAYEELREVVGLQLRKDYKSKHGGQVKSLKCFDLATEESVNEIFKKYNPCKN